MERRARGPLKAGVAPRSGACTEARRQHHQLGERQGLGLFADPGGTSPAAPGFPPLAPRAGRDHGPALQASVCHGLTVPHGRDKK